MRSNDRELAERTFLAARANAIQAYATIEQSLGMLCAHLLGAPQDLTGIVFFRITSARARNGAVEALIKKKFGTKYSLFWNSMFKFVNQTDQRRNEIVHWHVAHELGIDERGGTHEYKLTPPNIWNMSADTPSLCVDDLTEFIARCDIISRSMNMFFLEVVSGLVSEPKPAWLEIFQQPLVYPLPDTHPPSRNYKAS